MSRFLLEAVDMDNQDIDCVLEQIGLFDRQVIMPQLPSTAPRQKNLVGQPQKDQQQHPFFEWRVSETSAMNPLGLVYVKRRLIVQPHP